MAPAEDDISIEEKRVFAGQAGRTDAYLATDMGLVRVTISGDKIGGFELVDPTPVRDVAILQNPDSVDRLFVATNAGIYVAVLNASDETPVCSDLTVTSQPTPEHSTPEADPTHLIDTFDSTTTAAGNVVSDTTDTNPGTTSTDQPSDALDTDEWLVTDPVAIGIVADTVVIATADGRIVRLNAADLQFDSNPIAGKAAFLGRLNSPRAIDGPLIASAAGVARCVDDPNGMHLERVGLVEVHDVASAGVPLAATRTGLYRLGNGWMMAQPGPATAVAADGTGHVMAVCDGVCHIRTPASGRGWEGATWTPAPVPVDDAVPVALAYGAGLAVAVSEDGTLCVDSGAGWRHRRLGVPGIAEVALYERADGAV